MEKIVKETAAIDVFLNLGRHWMWDEFELDEVDEEWMFGPVKMAWMAVVPMQAMKKSVGRVQCNPAQIYRKNKFVYKKGAREANPRLSARHAGRERYWSCSPGIPT